MGLGPRSKTIIAAIASVIIHVGLSVFFFFVGLIIMFALLRDSFSTSDFYGFLLAGIATALSYIVVIVIIWFLVSKLTPFKAFATMFLKIGIPFAILVGCIIYSYIFGM